MCVCVRVRVCACACASEGGGIIHDVVWGLVTAWFALAVTVCVSTCLQLID